MKLENQVASLELSKKLKEFGIKQESLFYWWKCANPQVIGKGLILPTMKDKELFSAFTVAELGEKLLSQGIEIYTYLDAGSTTKGKKKVIIEEFPKSRNIQFEGSSEANARAAMLISLVEK